MSLKLRRNWDFSTFRADPARIARSKSVLPAEGNPGPGSRRVSKSMERPLKAGWLKKQQRSLVKNWQQRYFVLRGSTLTYHKDDRETTVLGFIQLQFSKINELPANSDDNGKYVFEIVPGTNGEKERCHYVFMANSQTDMLEWVRTLRKVVGVPSGGVFGKSLTDTVTYEKRFGCHMVPILVQKCVEYIREHGLNEEGIFRLPGQDNSVKQFRDAFDAGERPSFPSETDVHTVASLLKLYLRELPEPAIPWTQYQDFLDCTDLLDSNKTEGQEKLEEQISLLPRVNYNLLSYVCRFLFEVQLNSKVNKMSVENLATVMGINLLKPQIQDPFSVMEATPHIHKLMTVMIRQHETLFPLSKDVLPPSPGNKAESQKNPPRSFVGWESTEMDDCSVSECDDSSGPRSAPDVLQDSLPPSPSDSWRGSTRKRTQTLPTFNCPLTGMAAKAGAINRWSRVQEMVDEKSGTLSEDIFKILDLRSSESFFRGSPTNTKAGEVEFKERKGSDPANSQKRNSDSQPDAMIESGTDERKDAQQFDSLQQEMTKLRKTVAELQCTLEEERRRVASLEACLRSTESSRDQAQRRNEALQREIQRLMSGEQQAPILKAY